MMIGWLKGLVHTVDRSLYTVVLDVHGVGYVVMCPVETLEICIFYKNSGETCELFIETQISENSFRLFGFHKKEKKEAFVYFIGVQGVTFKAAFGLLDTFSLHELAILIVDHNANVLTQAHGIGEKTAHRLCVDLGKKISVFLNLHDTGHNAAADDECRLKNATNNDKCTKKHTEISTGVSKNSKKKKKDKEKEEEIEQLRKDATSALSNLGFDSLLVFKMVIDTLSAYKYKENKQLPSCEEVVRVSLKKIANSMENSI